jgi:hypothetical protein
MLPGQIPFVPSMARSWSTRLKASNNFLTHKIYRKSEGSLLFTFRSNNVQNPVQIAVEMFIILFRCQSKVSAKIVCKGG